MALTLEQIKDVVRGLPDDKVNPVDPDRGICLYTDPKDQTRHCIVGQLFVELGLPLPKNGENPSAGVAYEEAMEALGSTDDPAIYRFLNDLQCVADGDWEVEVEDREPKPWGEVKRVFELDELARR